MRVGVTSWFTSPNKRHILVIVLQTWDNRLWQDFLTPMEADMIPQGACDYSTDQLSLRGDSEMRRRAERSVMCCSLQPLIYVGKTATGSRQTPTSADLISWLAFDHHPQHVGSDGLFTSAKSPTERNSSSANALRDSGFNNRYPSTRAEESLLKCTSAETWDTRTVLIAQPQNLHVGVQKGLVLLIPLCGGTTETWIKN